MLPLTGTYYDATEKIWSGPKRKDLYNNDLSLGEAALEQLQKTPQKVIQIMDSTGETLTAKELIDYALVLAKNLLALELKPKDIIGLYAENTTHVATVMLASFLCGTPVNALYPGFDKETVMLIYKITKPKLIFCDMKNYDVARKANEDLDLKALIFLINGQIAGEPHIKDLLRCDTHTNGPYLRFPCLDLKGEDTAVIVCSSGTTGTPKAVLCSHHALLNNNIFLTLKSDSVVFCYSTMYWASGLLTLLSSLLNGVLRIITDKPFTPAYFLYLIEHYEISHILCNGSQLAELVLNIDESLIRKSLKSIDTLLCGGSKVPHLVQEKIMKCLSDNTDRPGFSIAYGMTEISGVLSLNGGHPCEFQELSEGKLMRNKKVRIIDKNGINLGPNEHGEISVFSPYKWVGYYDNPEATKNALINNWLYTGDIGFFDDRGFLHVCGRDKDVFKSSNFQIYPQIIEDIIMRIDGVAEVCVFGVPDFVASNLTAAAIVLLKDTNGLELTAEFVDQFVKKNMASVYHLKGGVYFVDNIPKTSSGKVQRGKILELVNK